MLINFTYTVKMDNVKESNLDAGQDSEDTVTSVSNEAGSNNIENNSQSSSKSTHPITNMTFK